MSTESNSDPCRICVEVERKRIVESFRASDPVELLDHVVKAHYGADDVRDFIARFGGEETCANCGESFYTTYRASGLGIVRDSYCPMCVSKNPLWGLSATRVDTEEWFDRQQKKREEDRSKIPEDFRAESSKEDGDER